MTEFGIGVIIALAVCELLFWGITIGLLRKVWNKVKD